MTEYHVMFRQDGDTVYEKTYEFDAPYFEHLAYLWGRYPDAFVEEAGATVEIRMGNSERVVLTGAYEEESEEAHPGWRFWTLDAWSPENYREIAFFSCD